MAGAIFGRDPLRAGRGAVTSLLMNPLRRRRPERHGFTFMPGGFPLVGHYPAIAVDYLGLVRRAERELGPVFWLGHGFGRFALTSVAPDAFSILKNKVTTSTYLLELLPDLFGSAIIAQDGDDHYRVRSALTGAFLPRGLTA